VPDAGPVPGACASLDAGAATSGQYAGSGHQEVELWKVEAASGLCLRVFLIAGGGPAYGVDPIDGYGIERVELTNAVADCGSEGPPTGQAVEASCGMGAFTGVTSCGPGCAPGGIYGFGLDATFEFPPMYPWVPTTDTYNASVTWIYDCGC